MDFLKEELDRLAAAGNLRTLTTADHDGCYVNVSGPRQLNLSSNDYLGLAADRALREEFLRTLTPENLIMSSASSRSLSGDYPVYGKVEKLLSTMFGREAALVFNSGYHMNAGIIPAIAQKDTLIIADKLVHASIIDGIRLSGAEFRRFRHNSCDHLESILQKEYSLYRHILVVVESVYSMDGDRADLRRLCALKRLYPNILLYVDEAHAFGIYGENGLGLAEEQGCIQDIDFLCGTFGKALGSMGGYVVCSQVVREFLINKMRTFIFSTALPPLNWAWTAFLLQKLPGMKSRRDHLAELSQKLRNGLIVKGFPMPSDTHIVPMMIGPSSEAVIRAKELQSKGFFVFPVRPPTVPEGTARLRFSLTADMTEENIDELLQAIEK